MIFTAGKEELLAAVTRAAQGLPPHPAQPVYAGLLLETGDENLRLTTGDTDTMYTCAARGEVHEAGRHIVPGRLLADICRYFAGDDVRLEVTGNQLEVTSGRSTFTLPARDGDEYPRWSDPPKPLFQLPGEELGAAIRAVSPATGDDLAVLTAICTEFEDNLLKLVTTDHSRMALAEIPVTAVTLRADALGVPAALLPAKAAQIFARNCEGIADLGWDDTRMVLSCAGMTVTIRQIGGTFLPWRNILKKEPAYIGSFPVKELARAVRMASLAAGPDNRVALTFAPSEITVAAGREGRQCAEYAPCTYEGKPQVFLFGAQNVVDGLGGCPEDDAEVAFTAPPAPLFLRSGNYRYMMMPRREL